MSVQNSLIEDQIIYFEPKVETKKKTPFTEKIVEFVKTIFEALKNFFTFPLRYIGSKKAGYHAEIQKTLTPKETLAYVKYGAMAAAQHNCDQSWIEPFGLKFFNPLESNLDLAAIPGNLEAKENCFYDATTGLKAVIAANDDEVIISFGALDSARHLFPDQSEKQKGLKMSQYGYVAQNLLGGQPACYEQAHALFNALKDHPDFKGKTITLAGQCLGGSMAQYVALKNEVPAVCFNTLALGAGLQYAIGSKAFEKADDLITHISAQTDFVSDNRSTEIFDRALCFLGIRTPGNFGKHYDIPAAYTKRDEIHDYMVGSVMKYVGYDIRNKPSDMNAEEISIAKNFKPTKVDAPLSAKEPKLHTRVAEDLDFMPSRSQLVR